MTENSESVKQMWQAYLDHIGGDESLEYTAWYFCDTEPCANELAELVKAGIKRATASALWVYEKESEPLPQVGELSVITDFHGEAQCIIKTTKIEIVPFNEVTEEFAAREGEGDKSLTYWRDAHIRFFDRTFPEFGLTFSEDMPVICETFEVVFPLDLKD